MREVSTTHIAKRFGVTKDAIAQWRRRYPTFPKPVRTDPYPLYDMDHIERWYHTQWPGREDLTVTTIHRYRVGSEEGVQLTSVPFGPIERARGYLQGVRELQFSDWRVFWDADSFSAHRGNEIEVWVLDPTTGEPDPWYIHDARLREAGKSK